VLLGYGPDQVSAFQTRAAADGTYVGKVDGDPGPKTRAALHMSLVKMDSTGHAAVVAAPAPVVAPVDKPVAVVAKGSDKRGWLWGGGLATAGGTVWSSFIAGDRTTQIVIGVGVLAVVAIMLFFGDRIIRRVKTLRDEIGNA